MENMGIGAGIAGLAFWMFVAAVVVAGIWENIKKREAQHETVRRIIESGQAIDEALIDKLLAISDGKKSRTHEDFRVTGLWLLPVALGLAVFSLFMMQVDERLGPILLGVASLVGCVGVGALIAARITRRWHEDEESSRR